MTTTNDNPESLDQRVVEFLRQNRGRWLSRDIAEALDVPRNHVSAAVSTLDRKSRKHGGAGVYQLKAASGSAALAAWCHSRPTDHELFTHHRRRSPKPKAKAAATMMTLTRSTLAPDVWLNGDQHYRLVPVKVEVHVVAIEDEPH